LASGPVQASNGADKAGDAALTTGREHFIAAMDDDLNTSAALGELFELARPLRALANRLRVGELPRQEERSLERRWLLLVELAAVLGLRCEATVPAASFDDAAIEALVAQRASAKANRDFSSADQLRDQLRQQGIELVDKPGGVTIWMRR
jgi:cysteinyl-tRNA synthetase